MKKTIIFIGLLVICSLINGCVSFGRSSSPAFQTLFESYFYPILTRSMIRRGIPSEDQEEYCYEIKKRLEKRITKYMSEKEIEEVNMIFSSQRYQNVIKNGISNKSLTEEEQQFLINIESLSSGYSKFISEEMQSIISDTIINYVEEQQNNN